MVKKLLAFGLVVISNLLVGCAHLDGQQMPNDPNFAPVQPEPKPVLTPDMGSIYYPEQGLYLSLYDDIKAHQVGDLITVNLVEKTNASKKAESKFDKNATATIAEPTLLTTNADFGFPKQLPIPLKTTDNLGLATNIAAERALTGTADSKQENKLLGTITVMVTQVFPNGNLFVRGEKWININDGDEFVRVSGIIRVEDVRSTNVIDSDRLADARISYSGTGAFANSGKPGWITKIITSPLWPL